MNSVSSSSDAPHFVDNDSAVSCLVKGYSPQVDSVALVGDYWLRCASLGIGTYVDRVESKSNIADGPSRCQFSLLSALGAQYIPPVVGKLLSWPSNDPSSWFATDPAAEGMGVRVMESSGGSHALGSVGGES